MIDDDSGIRKFAEKISKQIVKILEKFYSAELLSNELWGASPIDAASASTKLPAPFRFSYSIPNPDRHSLVQLDKVDLDITRTFHPLRWALACARQIDRTPAEPYLFEALIHWHQESTKLDKVAIRNSAIGRLKARSSRDRNTKQTIEQTSNKAITLLTDGSEPSRINAKIASEEKITPRAVSYRRKKARDNGNLGP